MIIPESLIIRKLLPAVIFMLLIASCNNNTPKVSHYVDD